MQKALTATAPVAPAWRATRSLARHARAALRPTACALAVAAALAAPAAHAVTYNWVGSSANGLWSTGSNWAGSVVPPSNGLASADIVFGASAFRATVLQAAYSVLSLNFSAAAGAYSFSGAPLTLGAGGINQSSSAAQSFASLVVVGAAQTWSLANGSGDLSFSSGVTLNNALTINAAGSSSITAITGSFSGSGALTKTGDGILRLLSQSTNSGTTTISAGTLVIDDAGGLGSGNVVNNASLVFGRATSLTFANVISGSGNVTVAGNTSDAALTFTGANNYTGTTAILSGALVIADGGSLGSGNVTNNAVLVFDRSTPLTVANAIGGTGSLTKSGSGTLTLTGANSYTGGTIIFAGGALTIGDGGRLGTGPITNHALLRFDRTTPLTVPNAISGGGDIVKVGSGTVTLTGGSTSNGTTTIAGGVLAIGDGGNLGSGNVVNNATLQFDRSTPLTVANAISGSGQFVKTGTGALTLTGANTSTGTAMIEAGTLTVGDGGSLGSLSQVILATNAVLRLDRATPLTVANPIVGFGNLAQAGTGTVTLTGANTYIGRTSVGAGTLEVGSGGSLTGTAFTISGGATLAITGTGQVAVRLTDGSLNDASFIQGAGQLLLSGNSRLTTGVLYVGTGTPGSLTQSGGVHTSDTLVFGDAFGAGSGTYQLDGGTLAARTIVRGGVGVFNFNGGTLQTRGNSATFLQGLTAANVQAGGARIDSNGFDITIGQALLHDASTGAIDGGLAKLGGGTLTLSGSNSFNGPISIAAGTLAVANDAALGAGAVVTVGGGGRLLFAGSATSTRNYSLGTVPLAVASGSTLTLANGAALNGGFLAAGGTFAFVGGSSMNGTTAALGSSLSTAGAVNFANATLRGSTTVGSGSVLTASNTVLSSAGTLAVNGRINADYFESNGVTTINSGGTLAITAGAAVLGGGSRTTVLPGGTLAAASSGTNPGSIELNGALLVNNGTQTGNLNVNFGSVAKGAGIFGNVSVGSGGTFAPGNSPGTATVQNFTFGSGGAYEFELNRATGTPGVNTDLLRVLDTLSVAASNTPGNRFTISIVSLNASNGPAPLSDFNASLSYSFLLVDAAQISGYAFDKFTIDSSRFLNDTRGGQFSLSLDAANSDLYLVFAPVPEPGTWLTLGLGLAGIGLVLRRRMHG